ncbi:ATP-NAD kinase family protein [Glaciecola sp. XM2]|jgi:predicted polyphosphate/ATP-dependent NAD kinase|uniref:ATP-NAD kinase family protein n=1 Tax=Glaciecola sp. XM2 TaxID=1914931 RepID=UPI001BDF5383|nr:ATP-NAD kinase family protein [Glaciecola sp. XM2]MBT1450967.1 ATP-NAD kinase family protein [Glaciecola sp. XM2]
MSLDTQKSLAYQRSRKFKLGLIVNPFAGIGGALALKGSDTKEIREKALNAGAEKKAMDKTLLALKEIVAQKEQVIVYTASADMGEDIARQLGFEVNVVYQAPMQSEDSDTEQLARALMDAEVDLILFAGGDGTARNIFSVIDRHVPVVGVPAGCKIHSGVYAITPRAAGKVVQQVISGELVSLFDAEVKDIDEQAFRNGQVIARYFGEMQVPEELSYIQAVKMGGKESDELVLSDIAAYVIEMMEEQPERIFVMGSGSTVDFIMHAAGLENTLLGVDLVQNMEVIANDVSAQQLLALTENIPTSLVITLIGGQGHIFGRGNQQLSPEFIKRIGKENIHVVATKNKLTALGQKGLISDTGDEQVNASLSGPISVITGYKDKVLYFVRGEDI